MTGGPTEPYPHGARAGWSPLVRSGAASTSIDACVHLCASGCSVLVDVTLGRLPAIRHWGADLGVLDEEAARGLVEAQLPVVGRNEVDVPVRIALLPEHHTGWVGRPGLSGSREGRSWSTKFRTRTATLDGAPIGSYAAAGPAVLEVTAVDDEAELSLVLTLESAARRTTGSTTIGSEDATALTELNEQLNLLFTVAG